MIQLVRGLLNTLNRAKCSILFYSQLAVSVRHPWAIHLGELGSRLKGDVYLDYAAAGLYTNTQIDAHAEDLKEQLYGNPHSLSTLASALHCTT